LRYKQPHIPEPSLTPSDQERDHDRCSAAPALAAAPYPGRGPRLRQRGLAPGLDRPPVSTEPAGAAYLATHGQARTEQIAKLYADMTAEGLSYLDKIEELCERIGITRRPIE